MRVEKVQGGEPGRPLAQRKVHMSAVGLQDGDPSRRYVASWPDAATQLRPALVMDGAPERGGAFAIEPVMDALLAARREERRRKARAVEEAAAHERGVQQARDRRAAARHSTAAGVGAVSE